MIFRRSQTWRKDWCTCSRLRRGGNGTRCSIWREWALAIWMVTGSTIYGVKRTASCGRSAASRRRSGGLGRFDPAGEARSSAEKFGSRRVDFDGDGVTDTLLGELRAPSTGDREPSGSRTAVVRSGATGT